MRTSLHVKFPDHQGKYREFRRFRPSRGRVVAEKALSSLGFSSEFPTQRNRESALRFIRGQTARSRRDSFTVRSDGLARASSIFCRTPFGSGFSVDNLSTPQSWDDQVYWSAPLFQHAELDDRDTRLRRSIVQEPTSRHSRASNEATTRRNSITRTPTATSIWF